MSDGNHGEGRARVRCPSLPPPFRGCRVLAGLAAVGALAAVAGSVPNAAAGTPPRLRVVTYNVHHGEGTDGRLDLARQARLISSLRPDLVALQELDRGTERTGRVDQPAELGRLTGMAAVFRPSMPFQGGEYGNGILAVRAPTEAAVHPLPGSGGREPRSLLTARVRPRGGLPEILFASTHLCHQSEEDRLDQTAAIRRLLPRSGPLPVVLAGDLNAREDRSPLLLLRSRWVDPLAGTPKIDYVLIRAGDPWRVVEARVVDERIASDHPPVVVELEWRGG